jgi:uncharacterized protein (DUF1015 family)
MATIRAFRGLRYSDSAGPLESLVAPPYDVLSPEERDAFAAKSPHNIVHLTLPESKPDDRSKFVKYARSASRLEEMRREGLLRPEERPAFYRYTQTFAIPGTDRTATRTALIAAIKVEPYEKGVVLPHEQTFPKHKEDRLRILEATRAHLECIYGLFEDDDQEIFRMIREAPSEVVEDVTTEDGVHHLVEKIDDPNWTERITDRLAPKKVWIADGHHRYETACTFRAALGERDGEVAEDYMMMALSSIADPGLVLLPTHRILERGPEDIEKRLRSDSRFEVSEAPNRELMSRIEAIGREGGRAFGVALPGGTGLVLRVRDLGAVAGESDLERLDVSILHTVLLGQVLGFEGYEGIAYTRDATEAVEAVEHGAKASFLMNPPTVDDMRRIALAGQKMPQKSTYYYPKILSGLALWSLNDFQT